MQLHWLLSKETINNMILRIWDTRSPASLFAINYSLTVMLPIGDGVIRLIDFDNIAVIFPQCSTVLKFLITMNKPDPL